MADAGRPPDAATVEAEGQLSPRDSRSARIFRATIIVAGVGEVPAMIRNVSAHGLGGRTSSRLIAGQQVTVAISGIGKIGATVRWTDDERFGLLLDRAIDPEKIRFAQTSWEQVVQQRLSDNRQGIVPRPLSSTWRPSFRHR